MRICRLFISLFIPTLMLIVLTGCWDRVELNDLAITLGTAVDLEEDGTFRFTLQIPLPGHMGGATGGGGGSGGTKSHYMDTQAATSFREAVERFQSRMSRKLHFAHRRIIIVSRELAEKEGISSMFDSLARVPENRLSSFLIISEGKAADLLALDPKLERFSSDFFRELSMFIARNSLNMKDIAVRLQDGSTDPYLPYVGIRRAEYGNIKIEQAEMLGYAQLKGDKMVGLFEGDALHGLIWLSGFESFLETIQHQGEQVSMFIKQGQTRISVNVDKEHPHFEIRVYAQVGIVEDQSNVNLSEADNISKYERLIDQTIEQDIRAAIKLMQEKRADNAAFGKILYRKAPLQWQEKYQHHWEEHLAKSTFNVRAKSTIYNIGMTSRNIAN